MAFYEIKIEKNKWTEIAVRTAYFQAKDNKIEFTEALEEPSILDAVPSHTALPLARYEYHQENGTLWARAEAGATVVVDTSLNYDTGTSEPFYLAVAKGKVPGHTWVDKYGENPDISTGTVPEDVWEYGGEYIFDDPGTAPIVSVVSDSPLDTQRLEIPTGLDIDGNETYQEVVLNGTTRGVLPVPLWRFNRAGTLAIRGDDFNGTIYFYTGTGNVPAPSEIRGIIDNGNNQTLMAVYTIPLGKVGFLIRGEVGGSRAQNTGAIQCSYYSGRLNQAFRIKKRIDITNQGTSVYQDVRSIPDPIPALTDIKIRVENVSANNVGVFAAFDIMLVDASEFPASFLAGISQPSEMVVL